MTKKINIFNYEVFYLDYLEGNLSTSDTEQLMAFLRSNPHLQLEDEELHSFAVDEFSSQSAMDLEDLKMFDEHLPVTTENVRFFFIAEQEGILSPEKLSELNKFTREQGLLDEKKGYEMVYFHPDPQVVFADKEGLKKKSAALAWYLYPSAIAALLILAFLLFRPEPVKLGNDEAVPLSGKNKDGQQLLSPAPGKNDSKNKGGEQPVLPSTLVSYPGEVRTPERSNRTNREVQGITDKLAINRPTILGNRFSQDSLKPVSPSLKIPEKEHDQLYAQALQDDMYNPIEPITRAISDKTKMPIDFRKTKPNSAKKGFHLKIGKFEVSRNGH